MLDLFALVSTFKILDIHRQVYQIELHVIFFYCCLFSFLYLLFFCLYFSFYVRSQVCFYPYSNFCGVKVYNASGTNFFFTFYFTINFSYSAHSHLIIYSWILVWAANMHALCITCPVVKLLKGRILYWVLGKCLCASGLFKGFILKFVNRGRTQ
jgi:hypothetical protein